MGTTASQAIVNFLKARLADHNGPDLLERYLKYGTNMETHLNVDAGKGEPVAGMSNTYSDGIDTWFPIRIPKDSDTQPWFEDYPLRWAIDEHGKGIGSTGWDWKEKLSRWVGFDVDSLIGHAAGVGISNDDMHRLCNAAAKLPYVEIRRSSRGNGRHLYVMLDGYPTENHTVHAALARCILGVMSHEAGFDFGKQNGVKLVDQCGGNMWIWHRYANKDNQGLALIKPATELFPADKIPANWRDHIDVIKRNRQRIRLVGISGDEEDIFNELTSSFSQVPLDPVHHQIIEELARAGVPAIWVPDHRLLQTHTVGFQRIFESGKYKGVYQTNSPGSNLGESNCFAFPLYGGGWRIFRFGSGTSEASTWEQSDSGYTFCNFNTDPDVKTASRACEGKPLSKGGYEFASLEKAAKVGELIGAAIKVDDALKNRTTVVNTTADGSLLIQVKKDSGDPKDLEGWNQSDKSGYWTQVIDVPTQSKRVETADIDSVVRCLKTPKNEPAGWAIKSLIADEWLKHPSSNVKMVLQDMEYTKPEAEKIMGRAVRKPWTITQVPFAEEYLENRQWNLGAPQLKVVPASRSGGQESRHPTFDRVLNHIGHDLTPYLRQLPWAQSSNIITGGDYLKCYISILIRHPFAHLPYLFVFSREERTGKSTLHEMLNLLFTHGVVHAEQALTSEFNGQLYGAIVCVIEELDLSGNKKILAKIKNYVNSSTISIRQLYQQSFQAVNTTHWIQCANDIGYCPVFDGDTRITFIHVNPIPEGEQIPKTQLMEMLQKEAPEFLRTLLDMELPPEIDRLRLPVVETNYKRRQQSLNRSALEVFLSERCFYVPGETIAFPEFYKAFLDSLPVEEKINWSKNKVGRQLPEKFETGYDSKNVCFLTNISWEDKPPTKKPILVIDNRIRHQS